MTTFSFDHSRHPHRPIWRSFACLAALTTALHSATPSGVQNSEDFQPEPLRGEAAIQALGDRLSAVAGRHGESAAGLRRLLSDDHNLWVDRSGRLVYICAFPPLSEEGTVADGITSSDAPMPLDQTFQLHSRPSATRKIYLDFDGHVTSGTPWNSNFSGGADFSTPAFDLDGVPGNFSTTELDRIQYIWQRVIEDFSGFEVDVTTEDPGTDALRKTTTSDTNHGIRVCIGGSSSDWYGSSAGGVAYIGSFTWNTDSPCYVFTAQLGSGNEKYTAEAISHEVGHTVGLHHDGKTDGTSYYQGHGNWAPIMGVGYYRAVTQWSKGEYPLANNTQDDLAIMSGYVPVRTDDHGDWLGGATVLSGAALNAQGVVERSTDFDLFQFVTGAGTVGLNINPDLRSPNLDIQATLYDGAGAVIATSNPPDMAAGFSLPLPAGTYYLEVTGVGTGDPATGYSDYASLGQYTISGTVVPSGQPPSAVAAASPLSGFAPLTVQFSSDGSQDGDGSLAGYSWEFGDGAATADPNPIHIYTAPGSYTASLVVTDNEGYTGFDSVVISILNHPPTATASATPTAGFAPLAVNFSSAGSSDADGLVVGHLWNFGDGSTSTTQHPSHIYSTPGSYTATLTVTDNLGATGSTILAISAQIDPARAIFVSAINMSSAAVSGGYVAQARVTVIDTNNNPVPGATVSGTWSGVVAGSAVATTDLAGIATFTSPKSKKTGPYTFTVTNVTATGRVYDSTRNSVSSASITHAGSGGGGGGTGGGGGKPNR